MEIERMFLNTFSIEKLLVICELIEAAKKHPVEFEKRKKRIFNMIMYPGLQDIDDEDDDISTLDDDYDDGVSVGDDDGDSMCDEDDMTSIEEPKKEEPGENRHQEVCTSCFSKETQQLQCSQLDDADKRGTPQSHNTTTMASRKRMPLMNESTKSVQATPPRVRLLSDFSFEKQLDGDKQHLKRSHKGFKKMENDHDTEKKKEEVATKMENDQQTPTQRKRKECTTGLMKTNVATKPVQEKELVSDCSITRPMQKETESISDMKKKFEC